MKNQAAVALGSIKSEKKAQAARENGKKGGRPLIKEIIKDLYKQGLSYAEIGRRYNMPKQRIHQIVKNYHNTGRQGREEKYRDLGMCESCKAREAEILHHRDLNNANDDISNLEKLCRKCHPSKHSRYVMSYKKGVYTFTKRN